MERYVVVSAAFAFCGCTEEGKSPDTGDAVERDSGDAVEEAPSVELDGVASLLVRVRYREGTLSEGELIHSESYELEEGRVTHAEFTNFSSPEYSGTSSFEYDDEGRLLAASIDGEPSSSVVWEESSAVVYNASGGVYATLTFEGDRILTYGQMGPAGEAISLYSYDANGNVASLETPPGVLYAEYLDYDTSKTNPLYLIRSIAMLRISQRPHFRNIFATERVQPIEGDDFSIGLADYQYSYTFDDQGRVATVEDESSLIYTTEFEYD
jgi:hypothetical protein